MFHCIHRDISVCLGGNPETWRGDLWINWFFSATIDGQSFNCRWYHALRTKTSIMVAVLCQRAFLSPEPSRQSAHYPNKCSGDLYLLESLLQSDLCPHFTSGWRYWLPGWADHGSAHWNRGAAEESLCKAPRRGHGEFVSPVLLNFTAYNWILCISVSEGYFPPVAGSLSDSEMQTTSTE